MLVITVILLAVLVLVIVKPTTPSSRDLLIAVGAALVFMSLFVSAVLFTPMVEAVDNSDNSCGILPCEAFYPLLIVIAVSAMLGVIGLLCAPLAALICYYLAARRGLDALRYAVAGAVCSALLLLPGIYVVARLRDISVPRSIVVAGYALVYTFWLCWLYGYIAVIVSDVVPYHIFLDEETGDGTDAATDAVLVLWFVITGLFFLALVSSLLRLYRGHRTGQRSVHRGFVPAGAYLHPFLLLPWMIALPIVAVIGLGTLPMD